MKEPQRPQGRQTSLRRAIVSTDAPPPGESIWDRIKREEQPQAERLALWMAKTHKHATVLDVGCGPGLYVQAMCQAGLDAYGIDNNSRLVENRRLRRFDVTDKWFSKSMPFDEWIFPNVVVSLEVGEHIYHYSHDHYIELISDALTRSPHTWPLTVYFSAARPGQGGEGHISCESKAYWIELFHNAGFWVDVEATEGWLEYMRQGPHMGWLTQNGIVFRRTAPLTQTEIDAQR